MRTLTIFLLLAVAASVCEAQWVHTLTDTVGVSSFAMSGTNIVGWGWDGVLLSTDNGTSWMAVYTSSTQNPNVRALAMNGMNFFLGTDRGVLRSTDNGVHWAGANTGLVDSNVYALVVRGTSLFAGNGSGVFLSTNNGTSWTQTSLTDWVNSLVVKDTILFAGTMGGYVAVLASPDNGASWTLLNHMGYRGAVEYLAVRGMYLLVLAITHNGPPPSTEIGAYLSTDNGTSWMGVNTQNSNIRTFAMSGTNLFLGTDGGVFRSTDNGTSWIAASNGLTDTSVFAIAVSGTNLFAGTGGGVFRSTNDGTIWIGVNAGLTDTVVNSLAIAGTNLFAGTNTGVWRRPLSEMITTVEPTTSDLPHEYQLSQNYPNPFNPSTTIHYALPHTSFVTLTVYNTLGQRVAQLVNEQQQAGYHDVVFRGDGLASGVYFYRLQGGSFVNVKKFILLK